MPVKSTSRTFKATMHRIEFNIQTWQRIEIPYTAEEETVWQAAQDAAAAAAAALAPQALQASIVTAVQSRLDTFANTRGYSSTDSLSKYQNLSDAEIATLPATDQPKVTQFRAECRYLALKIAQTWAVLYAGLDEVKAGTRAMPTSYADVEPLLPALVWPA